MKRISKSERIIMEVLWSHGELTAAQIVKIVQQDSAWSDKTILTFVHRLRQKGYILTNKQEINLYRTALSREQVDVNEATNVLTEHFGGSIKTMMTHFIDSGTLSREEIQQLRDYLNELSSAQKGDRHG